MRNERRAVLLRPIRYNWSMVFVTGASGHLGNTLVRSLLSRGHAVRVLVRDATTRSLAGLEVERIEGDLSNRDALRKGCEGAEWVIHSAALISTVNRDAKRVAQVNIDGTRNMIDAALAGGVERFVYVSSVEAIDLRPPGRTISEVDYAPERSIMPYGRTKARASLDVLEAVRERGLPAIIGIPSALIGPFDFGSSRTCEMVRRFLAREIPGCVDGGFDFVDVRDVAEGLISAAERGTIGESYFLTGELVSYLEITRMLGEITGVRMPRLKAPYAVALPFTYIATWLSAFTGKDPLYTPNGLRILRTWPRFDLTKSEADLGYRPRPIAETIADTAAWVQGHFEAVTEERE